MTIKFTSLAVLAFKPAPITKLKRKTYCKRENRKLDIRIPCLDILNLN